MELKMIVENICVDAAPINFVKLNSPGYIDNLKSELEENNRDIIDLSREKPQFCIDTLPSAMNFNKRRLCE